VPDGWQYRQEWRPKYPLRTLDALHLAVARHEQVDAIATADSVMAETAQAMGFAVARF
jgi:hypothetical protein